MKGHIKFLKTVRKNGSDKTYNSGDVEQVLIHYIGVRGGFERYPSDNTMEGSIDPICIIQTKTGDILVLELHYEVNLIVNEEKQ